MELLVDKSKIRFQNFRIGDIVENEKGKQFRVAGTIAGTARNVLLAEIDKQEYVKDEFLFSTVDTSEAIICQPQKFTETYVNSSFGNVPYPNGRCEGN